MAKATPKTLTAQAEKKLLAVLEQRFGKYEERHQGIAWAEVSQRLSKHPGALWSLQQMEDSGGEPDLIGKDTQTKALLFADCSAESPAGRRSICYDREGLESRKENRPANSACDLAAEMGVQLMSEATYQRLQALGVFDCKTSSWLLTPPELRKEGGAIFGDRRFGRVFIYHNGAQSYYAARGFRAVLSV